MSDAAKNAFGELQPGDFLILAPSDFEYLQDRFTYDTKGRAHFGGCLVTANPFVQEGDVWRVPKSAIYRADTPLRFEPESPEGKS